MDTGFLLTRDSIIYGGFNPDNTMLELVDQEITEIEPYTFDTFLNLEQLLLGYNRVTELPLKIFDELVRVRQVNLSNNLLTTIREELFQCNTRLEDVNLSFNQLQDFAISKNLSLLINLQLQNNQIKALRPQIFARFKNLQFLDLSNNLLTTLPELFFAGSLPIAPNSTALKELCLQNNQLQTLPAQAFANLQKLEYLNLADNKLTELSPQFFAALPNLKTLIVGRNLIKRLPNPINLPNLEAAYFKGNPLEEKPQIASTKLRVLEV